MLSVGIQRTLAWVRSASATQTLACAAATISGRASESRNAVARLIGNRTSVGSGDGIGSFTPVSRGLVPVPSIPSNGPVSRDTGKGGFGVDGWPPWGVSGTTTGDDGDRGLGGWAAHRIGPTQPSTRPTKSIHAQVDRSIDSI